MYNKRGFSLVEIVIVIAIIGVLAAVVIVAFNPQEIYANSRNTRRVSDVDVINNAIAQWLTREGSHDLNPYLTLGLTTGATALSPQDGGISGEGIDASELVILEKTGYIESIPKDPEGLIEYRVGVNDITYPSIIYVCSDRIEETANYPQSLYPNSLYCRTN
jgi:prepilin-type N-terminal cleavage/methylation domain-containing protein